VVQVYTHGHITELLRDFYDYTQEYIRVPIEKRFEVSETVGFSDFKKSLSPYKSKKNA
jgi:hypothetical protein